MKKFGFTLGEVLIALTLVGIISALTIPTLVGENQKKVYGASLATAVSNFETATRSMIQAEDVPDLFSTRAWRGLPNFTLNQTSGDAVIRRFMANLGDYIELIDYSSNAAAFYNGKTIRDINRTAIGVGNWAMQNKVVFQANNGAVYMVEFSVPGMNRIKTEAEVLANNINLKKAVGTVAIDINGAASPNTFGRDIFYFYLSSDGVLYPSGSRDVSYYERDGDLNSVWNGSARFACSDVLKNDIGVGCTARLIENGYKMDY